MGYINIKIFAEVLDIISLLVIFDYGLEMTYNGCMLLEGIILSACLQGKGCDQSMEAYYRSEPQLQMMAQNGEKKANQVLGETVTHYFLPVAALAVSDKASVKLNEKWAVTFGKSQGSVMLRWTY